MAVLVEFNDENNLLREVGIGDPLPVTTSVTGRAVSKTVTLTGATHLGKVNENIPLFTVTGNVFAKIFGVCSVDLVSAGGGTLEVGTANNTAALIAQTTATTIDANEIWYNNTPVAEVTASSNITEKLIVNGADIQGLVGTGDITAGAITFYCYFMPLSSGATVVSA